MLAAAAGDRESGLEVAATTVDACTSAVCVGRFGLSVEGEAFGRAGAFPCVVTIVFAAATVFVAAFVAFSGFAAGCDAEFVRFAAIDQIFPWS